MDLSTQETIAVEALAQQFRLDRHFIKLIHRGEGLVFETRWGRLPSILKLTTSNQDISGTLKIQLDWINFLHENGLQVPLLLESSSGDWLEKMEINGIYYTAFSYLKLPLTEQAQIDWKDSRMPWLVGETMGKMHRLARSYHPGSGCSSIGEWDDADWIRCPEKVLNASQVDLFPSIANLHEVIAGFPRTTQNYGLIHDDFHTGNLFYLDNQIAVIDFGCLHQSWFAQDISSALLFRVWIAPEKENLINQAVDFLKRLIEGYRTQAEFPAEWLAMFPALLKLRELSLYQSFYNGIDIRQDQGDPLFWYLYESIRDNTPFLQIDFEFIH